MGLSGQLAASSFSTSASATLYNRAPQPGPSFTAATAVPCSAAAQPVPSRRSTKQQLTVSRDASPRPQQQQFQQHSPLSHYPAPWLSLLHEEAHVDRLEALYQLSSYHWVTAPGAVSADGPEPQAGAPAVFPYLLNLQVQLNEPPSPSRPPAAPGLPSSSGNGSKPQGSGNGKDPDFYVNAGHAIRVLREDIPLLFMRELEYDIYREDIVFRDPRNTFSGMKNYQTIFWSLRFHGRIFFRSLYVEIIRIWQPEDKQIKMRWKVHGVPRIPWETEGTFDGISTYKLDSSGKIYEHQVDNVIFRDNPPLRWPLFLARLNLEPAGGSLAGQQPCPGAFSQRQEQSMDWFLRRFSWVRLYAVLEATAGRLPQGSGEAGVPAVSAE